MRYIADHDFHIHSTVSLCCHDENQTPERILDYAEKNGFNKICLTNHFWDENVPSRAEWCEEHYSDRVKSVLPLPQREGVSFLFGCETDMDFDNVLGISKDRLDEFDFVIVSTTHLHLSQNTVPGKLRTPEEAAFHWFDKIEALLEKELPADKIGIAHLTCGHVFEKRTPEVIELLDDERLYKVFEGCARKGFGIELNMKTLTMDDETKRIMLRPYFIAKDCGCRFYLGSDSHKAAAFEGIKENFEGIIRDLDLKESDKFIIKTRS